MSTAMIASRVREGGSRWTFRVADAAKAAELRQVAAAVRTAKTDRERSPEVLESIAAGRDPAAGNAIEPWESALSQLRHSSAAVAAAEHFQRVDPAGALGAVLNNQSLFDELNAFLESEANAKVLPNDANERDLEP